MTLASCATTTTPNTYRARVTTSRGAFVIEVHRDWAPSAAERFYELIRADFYSQARFYRVVKGFVVQFGMQADPAVHQIWQAKPLQDDARLVSNNRGTIALTGSARPNSRTTHVFINLADNAFLDETHAPFGEVVSGMDLIDSLYAGYGDHAPNGNGPEQERLWKEGNRYLLENFSQLDYIIDIELDE